MVIPRTSYKLVAILAASWRREGYRRQSSAQPVRVCISIALGARLTSGRWRRSRRQGRMAGKFQSVRARLQLWCHQLPMSSSKRAPEHSHHLDRSSDARGTWDGILQGRQFAVALNASLLLPSTTMHLNEVVLCATAPSASGTGPGTLSLHDIQTGTSLASWKQTSAGLHCTAAVHTRDGQGGFMLAAQQDKSIMNLYTYQKVRVSPRVRYPGPPPLNVRCRTSSP